MTQSEHRVFLEQCFAAAIESVSGETATRRALQEDGIEGITNLVAVGKAAWSMYLGAAGFMAADARGLIVTKYHHADLTTETAHKLDIIESSHPIPDRNSLHAGFCLAKFVAEIDHTEDLVLLVSGGASALAELLPEGMNLAALQELNERLITDGFSIDQINAVRTRISRIKGGKLLARFGGSFVRCYAISDVPGGDIQIIGSGIGSLDSHMDGDLTLPVEIEDLLARFEITDNLHDESGEGKRVAYQSRIIASNRIARDAVADFVLSQGYEVVCKVENLSQDLGQASRDILREISSGAPGIYIFGGEPTLSLPADPGRGGRNQHLALTLARELSGVAGISVLVAGTDGTDGPTDAAGGIIDSQTFRAVTGAAEALVRADSGSYLEKAGALFSPGPTGTNVMDLVIAIKSGD